jgi:Fe-S cluster assembly iron-binding protein IscA
MFTVTSKAKNKLKNDLINELEENNGFARVIYSPSNPSRIGFEIDQEKEDDLVIPDNEGEKLLLLSPDMFSTLRAFILDYVEEHNDRRFIINRYPDSILS